MAAHWIWNLADEHFGHRIEIVDFYHASEQLWIVAKALYGEGTEEAREWAQRQIRALRKKGVKPLLKALTKAHPPSTEAEEVLRREKGYFQTNAARMDYPFFHKQGLPIGSGAVESTTKHLVQQRFKRSGARWSHSGGQAVLAVRCRLVSNRPLAA